MDDIHLMEVVQRRQEVADQLGYLVLVIEGLGRQSGKELSPLQQLQDHVDRVIGLVDLVDSEQVLMVAFPHYRDLVEQRLPPLLLVDDELLLEALGGEIVVVRVPATEVHLKEVRWSGKTRGNLGETTLADTLDDCELIMESCKDALKAEKVAKFVEITCFLDKYFPQDPVFLELQDVIFLQFLPLLLLLLVRIDENAHDSLIAHDSLHRTLRFLSKPYKLPQNHSLTFL